MSSTSSSQAGPDGPHPRPTADEAARALRDIERRRDQARGAATNARWVYAVAGLVFFALLAAPDFLGRTAADWTPAVFGPLTVGYLVMLNTPGGAALLGQPVRARKQEISKTFRRYALLTLFAIVLAGFALQLLQPEWHLHLPYWRTAAGAVLGAVLALFGPRLQRALLAVAVRGGRRPGESAVDGTR
ncbi:hypothetical protein ACFU99_14810 [Streptomyces sp. NPDC057654]|uniref:hypothetical protein n=1 Tax=Streptomyces sp. NPDC057654 TaxID=3346196 RepID=UPI0036965648